VSLLLLLVSGLGYVAYRHYLGRVDRVKGLDLSTGQDKKGSDANYLLVGNDSADHLTDAQLREIGVNRVGRQGVRTDTVLLVHVPGDGSAASFASFPRDSLVTIPGHGRNKLNAAYSLGERERRGNGPITLVRTIEALSGLKIDHYVEISLLGFSTITNALGGVEVCLKRPARDEDAAIDLPAGRQTLHGKDALAFVRQRHGLPGEDFGRIKRQQYFVGALVRRALTTRNLLDPLRLNRVLNAAGDSVKVDEGTSGQDLISLARRLQGLAAGRVTFQTVPVSNPAARAHLPGQPRASVVLLDEPRLPRFFAALGTGDASAPSVTSTDAPTRAPTAASASAQVRTAAQDDCID
jgi:LCP family protein required for cell wall assembly